jgi:hypothetical protein
MAEYRDRTTGEIKSQGQLRKENPNMSMPKVWNSFTFDALNVDPVLAAPKPTDGIGQYQHVIRNGVVQDANNNWVQAWQIVDMFADDAELGTKAEQEAAYQTQLDNSAAERVRAERDRLLAESDWVAIRARELGQSVPDDWYTYRGDLRQVPEQDGFPHNVTWPTKPE